MGQQSYAEVERQMVSEQVNRIYRCDKISTNFINEVHSKVPSSYCVTAILSNAMTENFSEDLLLGDIFSYLCLDCI